MKKFLISFCALILAAPIISLPATAQDRYVSDVLYVPLRSGMGNQYRIVHRGLPSGTPLELVREGQTDDGEEWTLVRTQEGEEGWVRSQFLLEEPTAAIKLERLRQRTSNVTEEFKALDEQLAESRSEVATLEEQLEQVRSDYQALQTEHAQLQEVSSEAVNLHQQHQKLSENYQVLQTRHDVVQAENERLKRDRRYQEWMFGSGILVAGIILSLILQAIGKRRRQSEWR